MASHITQEIALPEFLSGGGEMGKLIRSKDWSKTPLGSPDTWPQSLRTTVSLCIASNFPISITWGPHRVQIYNDGYWPITGNMHPVSMGQDFKECWLSAWPVIGQAFEEASLGQTRFLENQRIFLVRYGYLEETFFTFSFSPILDESGRVGGLFHPVIELTQQTIAERRLNVLRVVADNTVNARTVVEASSLLLDCLKDFDLDLPFVLLYAIAADGKEANLQGNVGIEKDSPLAPAKINLEEHALKSWPFTEVVRNGKAVQVEELGKIFGTFNCGPYAEPPEQAMVFPVTLHGTAQTNYLLVAGISSRRSLDDKYLLFYELLTASITNALTKARAYEDERKKAEALAEIDKAKTVFFSNISHEFRTPLTLMLGSLEQLLNKRIGEIAVSEKESIETAHRNAMRLLRLVNNLLDFSRIEAGRVQAHYQLTDLAKYTTDLASNFRSVIENAGLIFQVKTNAIIQRVYIDTEMWEKIVLNLLSNAFKYTLKGSITISLHAENNHVVLKVKDTGIGIPENELPKMFQRFHRVQNVVGRTHEGTGIGLSLVSELVKLHGGEIAVQSKEAEGSVFTVSIPTGKSHLPTEQVFEKEIDPIASGFTASLSNAFVDEATTLIDQSLLNGNGTEFLERKANAPTVLVVDDNADMRAYIKNLLQKQYYVVTANNGMEALEMMKEHPPTLIVSDIMMPVMDGIQLLKAVKENIQTSHLPVILLSARAGEESKIEGYEIGADDYLIKPFSAKELIARVSSNIKTAAIRSRAEEHLYSVLMQTPVAIAIYRGPNFVVELVNDRMVEFYGKPREEIINRPLFEVFPEVAAHGVEALHRKVYETGERVIAKEQKHEYYKQGKLYIGYFNTVFEPLRNLDNDIIGLIVTGHEVTEEVIARKKIEESKTYYQTLTDNTPVMTWITAPDGNCTFLNKQWYDYTGQSKETGLGFGWFSSVHADDAKRAEETFLDANEKRVAFSLTYRLRNKIGEYRWHLDSGLPKFNEDGQYEGVIGSVIDIHESVEARKTIEESERQKAFLLKLSDTLRPLDNPVDIEGAVTKIALDLLDADWCHYSTIENDNLIIQRDASRGNLHSLAGVYPISSFTLFKAALKTALPFIIEDVHTTDMLDEELKQLCMQLQNISFVIVPVIKNGRPVGMLSLVQSRPRKWTHQEVQLTIETAERTWAAVERAKAEEALRRSEEKYRSLFNSIDEGVVTLELIFDENGKAVDWIYLEHNPALTQQTGMANVVGKRASELFTDLEPQWLKTHERIIKTGKSERHEFLVTEINTWFDTYFSKVGGEESHQIICVYNNITERKNEAEKKEYLLKLSDAIKELTDPVAIQLTACRILGEHVKVNRVLYGEVIDEEQIIINNNYVNGVPPINATLDAAQFGRNVIDVFKRNEKVIISDINTDPDILKKQNKVLFLLMWWQMSV